MHPPNSDGSDKCDQVFIDGASVWYQAFMTSFRVGLRAELKFLLGLEETSSSSKLKAIERSAVNRQFAEQLKFNARHTGFLQKEALTEVSLTLLLL